MKNRIILVLSALTVAGIAAVSGAHAAPAQAATSINGACLSVPKTLTEQDGIPGTIFYKRLQCLASMPSSHPYTGPIDGALGENSWNGVQARLDVGGYWQFNWLTGKEDALSVKALQRWANANGYHLAVNGQWSGATYAAVADCLNRSF